MAGWGLTSPNQIMSEMQWTDLEHPRTFTAQTREGKRGGLMFWSSNARCNGTKHPDAGWICVPVAPHISPQACTGDSGSPFVRRDISTSQDNSEKKPDELIGVLSSGQFEDLMNDQEREFRQCGQMNLIIAVRLCGKTLQSIRTHLAANSVDD